MLSCEMNVVCLLAGIVLLLSTSSSSAAGLLDWLGLGKSTNKTAKASVAKLSEEQVVSALKEALGRGVQSAISSLGRENGFLTNLNVRIPMPEKLRTVETTIRSLGQDKVADDFVRAMNHAAEQAVPQAAEVFTDAIRQLTIDDALGILQGTNNAATQYFRRTTETNLFARFHPIVTKSTDQAGVTAAYKRLMDRLGGNSTLGSLSRALLGSETVDMDVYITQKALDGLFKLVAEEEKRIRENPLARTTALLEKVFGAVGYPPRESTQPR